MARLHNMSYSDWHPQTSVLTHLCPWYKKVGIIGWGGGGGGRGGVSGLKGKERTTQQKA